MNSSYDSKPGKNLTQKQSGIELRSAPSTEGERPITATQAEIDQKVQERFPESEIEKSDFNTTRISSLAASILPHLLNLKLPESPYGKPGNTSETERGMVENKIELAASIAMSLYLASEKQLKSRKMDIKKNREHYRSVLNLLEEGTEQNPKGDGITLNAALKKLKPKEDHHTRRLASFAKMMLDAQCHIEFAPFYQILGAEKLEDKNVTYVVERLVEDGVSPESFARLQVLFEKFGDRRATRHKVGNARPKHRKSIKIS